MKYCKGSNKRKTIYAGELICSYCCYHTAAISKNIKRKETKIRYSGILPKHKPI